jgi:hypothetical protein
VAIILVRACSLSGCRSTGFCGSKRGEKLAAVRLRFNGTDYFLEDGFHRVEATKRVGVEEIEAEILPGTLADMEANYQEYLKALRESLSE